MHNNIIDMLGFKDRDIKVNVSKSSPSSIEITVSKICKPRYCTICNHRMYSRGPYTRTLNHPILQDKGTTKKIVGEVFLLNRKWFLFTMCYLVCSDIAHFDGKSKQKIQYHKEKQRKNYMLKDVMISQW